MIDHMSNLDFRLSNTSHITIAKLTSASLFYPHYKLPSASSLVLHFNLGSIWMVNLNIESFKDDKITMLGETTILV